MRIVTVFPWALDKAALVSNLPRSVIKTIIVCMQFSIAGVYPSLSCTITETMQSPSTLSGWESTVAYCTTSCTYLQSHIIWELLVKSNRIYPGQQKAKKRKKKKGGGGIKSISSQNIWVRMGSSRTVR